MQNCQTHGTKFITANGRCSACDADNLRFAQSAEFKRRAPRQVVR